MDDMQVGLKISLSILITVVISALLFIPLGMVISASVYGNNISDSQVKRLIEKDKATYIEGKLVVEDKELLYIFTGEK